MKNGNGGAIRSSVSPEAFKGGVVVTVPFTAHRGSHLEPVKQLPVFSSAVMASPAGMMDINPAAGRLAATARNRVWETRFPVILSPIAYPAISPVKRSFRPARYNDPSSVKTQAISLAHDRFGASNVKFCPGRFSATGSEWFEFVVTLNFFRCLHLKPGFLRIRLILWTQMNIGKLFFLTY